MKEVSFYVGSHVIGPDWTARGVVEMMVILGWDRLLQTAECLFG